MDCSTAKCYGSGACPHGSLPTHGFNQVSEHPTTLTSICCILEGFIARWGGGGEGGGRADIAKDMD